MDNKIQIITKFNNVRNAHFTSDLFQELVGEGTGKFANPDAILTGVETRSSSPVQITRDENKVSNIKGLYPCGEGAGYAGGITSAAMDGIKVAEAIISVYKPL